MHIRLPKVLLASCLMAFAVLAAEGVFGCSIPVFRYALERWPADPYEAVVFHRGPLAEEDQAIIETMRKLALVGENPANIRVRPFDLEKPLPKGLDKIWEAQDGPQLPWMVVLFPMMAESREVVWSGPFSQKAIDSLSDSPKRREIARRILSGESAVWVLLESGDESKDDSAETTLTKELARLKELIELPPMDELMPGDTEDGTVFAALQPVSMESTLPLRLAFSTLRVSRDDPAERVLVDILMKTEPDLNGYLDEPMVFPIFGRGRALYALVGRGINEFTIERAGAFLAGACSCVIKAYNPGTDLLISANWDAVLQNEMVVDVALPPLTGVMPFTPVDEDVPSTPAASLQTPEVAGPRPSSGLLMSSILIALALLVGVVAAGAVVIGRNRQASSG